MSKRSIVIIDYGSQYTQLITRRVRENNVYSEIFSHDTPIVEIIDHKPSAIILSGGPASVYDEDSYKLNSKIFDLNIPVLGICYGLQLLVQNFGGEIKSKNRGEYGLAKISVDVNDKLFSNIKENSSVWMSHGDEVDSIHGHWDIIGTSDNDVVAAVKHKEMPYYGVQFHPEVVHTEYGDKIISNFLFNIASCKADWTSENFVNNSIEEIKSKVGDSKVVCGLSGGVDSSVMATLMHKAIGKNSKCVFINHGLLRKNEVAEVMGALKDGLGLNIDMIDASEKFLSKLEGVTNPEKKRKIIGEQFIRTFEEVTSSLGDYKFLAQGTLYPDVIESGGSKLGPAVTIKSHHNVGGLPDDMEFDLIEPLKDLFKDEVRKVGKELNLPHIVLGRHPFPGPGLAVRIIGDITKEKIKILQESDHIFIETLREFGEYDNIWQAFAVLIPVKTVGVMGDSRTYENLIALRAVTSLDGMTADWYKMPSNVLNKCSNRIINEVKGVNRVVYDITSKPPGTIEWE